MSTFKQQHPKIPISIFTDDIDAVSLSMGFDKIFKIENPYYSYLDKLQIKNSPYDTTIFIDTDTICVEPVFELFELLEKCELIINQNAEGYHYNYYDYGLNVSMPEFNTGVIGFNRNSLNEKNFFEKWKEIYLKYSHITLEDQFSFRILVYNFNVRYCWIPHAYNYFIYFPAYTSIHAKIIHGRPFNRLHEIAHKINSTQKLKGAWHRTYYP